MKELFTSLAGFQQKCPVIHKGTQGYGYSYAELSDILTIINPLLKEFDLGFTQLVNGNEIKTIVFHSKTGQTLESNISIPQNVTLKGMNDFQVLGSAITYLRRYALSSALGIVTDKDLDACGTQETKAPTPTPTPTPTKKTLGKGKDFDAIVEKLKNSAVTIEKVLQFYNVSDELLKELKSYETV